MKIGDRVILVSKRWSSDSMNPVYSQHKIIGTIDVIKISGLPLIVNWDNGRINHYNHEDLKLHDNFGTLELIKFINETLTI